MALVYDKKFVWRVKNKGRIMQKRTMLLKQSCSELGLNGLDIWR